VPALPDVPNVIRIDTHWTLSEDTNAKVRFFYQYTGTAPTNTQLNTFCNAVMTAANTWIKGLMGADTTFDMVEATDLTSPTSAVGLSTNSPFTGTRAGAVLPADIALLNSSEVHRRYRGGHCRQYFPFGTQPDLNDEQTWGSTFLGQCNTDLAGWSAAIIAANWSGATIVGPVNVSYYNGFTVHTGTTGRARNVSTPRTSAIVDLVISSIVRAGIATIRKRLLRLA